MTADDIAIGSNTVWMALTYKRKKPRQINLPGLFLQ
jgi:hypothetical protein